MEIELLRHYWTSTFYWSIKRKKEEINLLRKRHTYTKNTGKYIAFVLKRNQYLNFKISYHMQILSMPFELALRWRPFLDELFHLHRWPLRNISIASCKSESAIVRWRYKYLLHCSLQEPDQVFAYLCQTTFCRWRTIGARALYIIY